ncbi:hypothetical protein ACU4GR_00405 [Methylobacterium oryzae CBMB20]
MTLPVPDRQARLAAAQLQRSSSTTPAELGEVGIEMLQGLAMELSETTRCFTLRGRRQPVRTGPWCRSRPG